MSDFSQKIGLLSVPFTGKELFIPPCIIYNMSRGRPRKYRTKSESKAAKKIHTKLFNLYNHADGSWYEREKAKRLRQPKGPLETLELEVTESMCRKLNGKKPHQRSRAYHGYTPPSSQVCITSKKPTGQESLQQLEAEMLRASTEIEDYLNEMEADIRRYISQKTSWDYAPFCGVL